MLVGNAYVVAVGQTNSGGGSTMPHGRVRAGSDTHHDTSEPLRNITPIPASRTIGRVEFHPPQSASQRVSKLPSNAAAANPAPVSSDTGVNIIPVMNEAGLGLFFTGPQGPFTPPGAISDATGAVGTTQYLQWVDDSFAIFDKASGNVLYGPAAGNTIWSGFGGACQNDNDGQPTVNFDKLANRWVVSQYAMSSGVPYLQCVAVSTTNDATGAWYRYSFVMGGGSDSRGNYTPGWINQNAKLGVWPDAYYMVFDMYGGATFEGEKFCALQRAYLIAGNQGAFQCVMLPPQYFGVVVSDLDGLTPPPAGAPAYFATEDPYQFAIDIWKFSVDWNNFQNTTLSLPIPLSDSNPIPSCSSSSFIGLCIPQPGTSQLLDSLGGRLVGRMPYRNYGSRQSLFLTETSGAAVTPPQGPPAATGITFLEMQIGSNGGITFYQGGTFAPDTSNFRFLPSIASDLAGNVAVAYNLSSPQTYPSQLFASRAFGDPLNTLGNETLLNPGNASQTTTSVWDYRASLTVDPVDDCTYWYTQQYIPYAGATLWVTVIAGQYLAGCPVSTVTLNTVPSGLSVSLGGTSGPAPVSGQFSIGSPLSIGTSTPQTGAAGTQYVFSNWSDGGALTHTVTVPSTNTTYTASFNTQYQLTTAVNPAGGGTVTPVSGSYFNANSIVNLNATPASGYMFTSWTGSVANPNNAATTITMSGPQSVTANFTLLPAYLTPGSVTYAPRKVGTTSPAKTFTLTNAQSVALTSIVISTTGDFAVSATTCTSSLAANSSCTINVKFTPTATGTRKGKLKVSDSAPNSPQTAKLKGTGL
jgi:hypothetical protein